MTAETARTPKLARALIPLGLVFLSVGISTALVYPFLALFLSTEVDAGPIKVTAFLIASPLAGVVVTTLIGRLSDRLPIRRLLLIIGGVAGTIGCGLTTFVRDYWILLGLTITAIAIAGSLFPQSFAYARQVLERDAPDRVALGISGLRTVFSLAWVAGPALAAVILSSGGFGWVYGTSAVMYALAALIGLLWLDEVPAPAPATSDSPAPEPLETPRWTLLLTAGAFALLQTPLTLAGQALPLYMDTELHGDVKQAGLVLGLCAALEIPFMLGLGALSVRVPVRLLLFIGSVFGIVYYALAALSPGVGLLFAGQVLNAVFISAVSGLGISYMQEMLPQHPGRATTLFTNSFPIGAMLAGPLFGLSQHFGYWLAYWLCVALCAAGLALLVSVRAGRVPQPG
ncbi:sugar efflux transporter [Actinoplanes sp. N902-109]|uniref:sugar efflux transporter n=1 Tax=Actinoplanes sp. (strain N902-109) TaxID=649831 RepID=UPI00032935D4|nr:sugar efflux transporter [Actinoplanes sp. N902-109]AGL13618.1 major facilitator superfamily protein [Actinoplanes sp. N902-109]